MRRWRIALLVTGAVLGGTNPSGATHPAITTVSVSSAGEQGDAASHATGISRDGRFGVFTSSAANLVAGDTNGVKDVFVRDRLKETTERVSVSATGEQANGPSSSGRISADGRHVAFVSDATNLVGGDTNSVADVFVHDLSAGTTTRASVSSAGAQTTIAASQVAISGDGSVVAFVADAALASAALEDTTVLLHSVRSGETRAADVRWTSQPSLSFDGRFVAVSSYEDLAGDGDAGGLFVIDTTTGTAERATLDERGAPLDATAHGPSLSADGGTVAYQAWFCGGFGGCDTAVYVTDLAHHVGSRLPAYGFFNSDPTLSADGRTVAWLAHFYDDGTDRHGVYLHDMVSGGTIGIDGSDDPASQYPFISGDGSTVTFTAGLDRLASGDRNGVADAVVWSPCPLGSRNDGPLTGTIHEYVTPHAGDLSFTLDQVGCDVVRPTGL